MVIWCTWHTKSVLEENSLSLSPPCFCLCASLPSPLSFICTCVYDYGCYVHLCVEIRGQPQVDFIRFRQLSFGNRAFHWHETSKAGEADFPASVSILLPPPFRCWGPKLQLLWWLFTPIYAGDRIDIFLQSKRFTVCVTSSAVTHSFW